MRFLLGFTYVVLYVFTGVLVAGVYLSPTEAQEITRIQVRATVLQVDIADTPQKRSLGLSFRSELAENRGMLFVYDVPILPSFWMKDMQFPLDIIWIRDLEIVGIDHDVSVPQSNELPQKYYPPLTVDMVLEVNAGWADENGLKVGDMINPI